MGRYVARRLLLTIPVLLGASFLIFAMVYALPGDPIRALAGDRPVPPAVVAVLNERFHLNDPLWVQYWEYLKALFTGDLGTDFRGRPVLDTIARTLPVTIKLTAVAVFFEVVIGIDTMIVVETSTRLSKKLLRRMPASTPATSPMTDSKNTATMVSLIVTGRVRAIVS